MAAQFAKSGRRVAAVAVLSLAMGGVMAMAQDPSAPPPAPPQATRQGPGMHGGMHREGGPEKRIEMMTKHLNLIPDQVSQVKAIQADSMTQAQGLRSDTTMSQEERHSKMMSIHEAAQTKIRAVLNDEQKTKFDAMQAHHREHMKHGDRQTARPAPPPA